jgi:hypothetical protein
LLTRTICSLYGQDFSDSEWLPWQPAMLLWRHAVTDQSMSTKEERNGGGEFVNGVVDHPSSASEALPHAH